LGKEIALESWLDDGVYHACWTRNSTDSFASVWWRRSELVLELAAPGRNISWREIYGLYPSAFAYFTGQDDRPLQESLRALGVDSPERALYAPARLCSRTDTQSLMSILRPPTSRHGILAHSLFDEQHPCSYALSLSASEDMIQSLVGS
jgi:hypothetical protein